MVIVVTEKHRLSHDGVSSLCQTSRMQWPS